MDDQGSVCFWMMFYITRRQYMSLFFCRLHLVSVHHLSLTSWCAIGSWHSERAFDSVPTSSLLKLSFQRSRRVGVFDLGSVSSQWFICLPLASFFIWSMWMLLGFFFMSQFNVQRPVFRAHGESKSSCSPFFFDHETRWKIVLSYHCFLFLN